MAEELNNDMTLQLRLPSSLVVQLDKLASLEYLTRSALIRTTLSKLVDENIAFLEADAEYPEKQLTYSLKVGGYDLRKLSEAIEKLTDIFEKSGY